MTKSFNPLFTITNRITKELPLILPDEGGGLNL
jgi:hypothetical protein